MAKWHQKSSKDLDATSRIEKIKKPRKRRWQKQESGPAFELEESKWTMTPERFAGRVVEVHKRYVFVAPEPAPYEIDGADAYLAQIQRRFLNSDKLERNLLCVGDRVLCQKLEQSRTIGTSVWPQAAVLHRVPRSRQLGRQDPLKSHLTHVLAANLDQVVIVASLLKPQVRWGLIDRYLVLCEEEALPAVIILNKTDLLAEASEAFRQECDEMIQLYRSMGYEVICCSLKDGSLPAQEKEQVTKVFQNQISLLTGHSGVGKSSLANCFEPEIFQEVEDNPDIFYKGRHTTTYASLIKLKAASGYVIDSPGIRSLALGERSAIQLTGCFRDMQGFLGQCRYRECTHEHEPDCAVLEALEQGELDPRRYRSYLQLLHQQSRREGRLGSLEYYEDQDLEHDGIDPVESKPEKV